MDLLRWQAARSLRDLWRSGRLTTLLSVAILAMCLGITLGVFTVINAVFLRPLPVTEPENLAFVYSGDLARQPMVGTSEDVVLFAAERTLLTEAAAVRSDVLALRTGLDVHHLFSEEVSTNYFDVLGITPRGKGIRRTGR